MRRIPACSFPSPIWKVYLPAESEMYLSIYFDICTREPYSAIVQCCYLGLATKLYSAATWVWLPNCTVLLPGFGYQIVQFLLPGFGYQIVQCCDLGLATKLYSAATWVCYQIVQCCYLVWLSHCTVLLPGFGYHIVQYCYLGLAIKLYSAATRVSATIFPTCSIMSCYSLFLIWQYYVCRVDYKLHYQHG